MKREAWETGGGPGLVMFRTSIHGKRSRHKDPGTCVHAHTCIQNMHMYSHRCVHSAHICSYTHKTGTYAYIHAHAHAHILRVAYSYVYLHIQAPVVQGLPETIKRPT